MNLHDLADTIIISATAAYLLRQWLLGLFILAESASKAYERRKRSKMFERWVAARRAARKEVEARMEAAGYWSNREITAAMDAAGRRAEPKYQPPWGRP